MIVQAMLAIFWVILDIVIIRQAWVHRAKLIDQVRVLQGRPSHRPDYARIKQLERELGISEPDPPVPLLADDKKKPRPYKGFLIGPPQQKYTVPNNGQPPQGPYEEPWLRDISGG